MYQSLNAASDEAEPPKRDCFTLFKESIPSDPLPDRFTFPFQYAPHPLCLQAAKELQQYIESQIQWDHNFGIDLDQEGAIYGKMFGVLVVQNELNQLGYLAAFSGKIGGKTHHPGFVPPVFDLLDETGFYRKEEEVLSEMNRQIALLEQNPLIASLQAQLLLETREAERLFDTEKQRAKANKASRNQRRETQKHLLSPEMQLAIEAELVQESMQDHFQLKDLKRHVKQKSEALQAQIDPLLLEIQELKETRRRKSSALQQYIFEHYFFLNQAGQNKSLADIFQRNAATQPPSGAGECAAPKLLQYAFLHHLKPVAMAEFWWGESPQGEIRKHGQFYPACRGKCEPILGHMLEGIPMDENPMLMGQADALDLEILFEDEHMVAVNKPALLLSVPGKNVSDSVYFRMKQRMPEASGPLIVHRLDMGTSGIMLIAKSEAVHKTLQSQFIRRIIKKRYVAILEGLVAEQSGIIDLPLRVDLDNRPRQMVCYTHGKSARTEWQVVSRDETSTRVHFFPITGRTHQLRVHAAHPQGLNIPILGDELYGTTGTRLYLHADRIEFLHPVSGKGMVVYKAAGF